VSNRWPGKLIVGLTGNIATGKSTVLRLAEEQGALALDADSFVHDILANDPEAQRAVVEAFGAGVVDSDGAIDRSAVATIVFDDESALSRLERILHPRVRRLLFRRIDRSRHDVVFIEAIKLLEGGLAAECDQIWVTRCPVKTQIQRLMVYRQLDAETASMRVRAQSRQELKTAAADVVIDTGGSLEMTEAQFHLAWARLQRRLSDDAALQSAPTGAVTYISNSKHDPLGWQDEDAADGDVPIAQPMRHPQPRNFDDLGPDISVRRAQPNDIEAMVKLVSLATHGVVALEPGQLLDDLGQRGYLIGQQAEEVTAIGGWNAENLVARVDCLYAHPPEALAVTGAAILREIEITANELICEAIIALLGQLAPDGTGQLLRDRGFSRVDPETLPQAWRASAEGNGHSNTKVMLKILRNTRQVRVRRLKE
jgi:dephospho-CoA kinase